MQDHQITFRTGYDQGAGYRTAVAERRQMAAIATARAAACCSAGRPADVGSKEPYSYPSVRIAD